MWGLVFADVALMMNCCDANTNSTYGRNGLTACLPTAGSVLSSGHSFTRSSPHQNNNAQRQPPPSDCDACYHTPPPSLPLSAPRGPPFPCSNLGAAIALLPPLLWPSPGRGAGPSPGRAGASEAGVFGEPGCCLPPSAATDPCPCVRFIDLDAASVRQVASPSAVERDAVPVLVIGDPHSATRRQCGRVFPPAGPHHRQQIRVCGAVACTQEMAKKREREERRVTTKKSGKGAKGGGVRSGNKTTPQRS